MTRSRMRFHLYRWFPIDFIQDQDHPWVPVSAVQSCFFCLKSWLKVCEHRWQGVPGMVRFRRLMGDVAQQPLTRWRLWSDKLGHAAFGALAWSSSSGIAYHPGLRNVTFVALNHGYNWWQAQCLLCLLPWFQESLDALTHSWVQKNTEGDAKRFQQVMVFGWS